MATNDKLRILGDSNIRNAFSGRLGKLSKTVGCTTEYVPATSMTAGYAALKTTAEFTILLISFLLNGIADSTELCVDSASIDNMMNQTIDEYCLAILELTRARPDVRYYVMPPFFRSTPTWMRDKITYIGDRIRTNIPSTLGVIHIPPIAFEAGDLYDNVHLNNKAQVRLYEHITSSIFPDITHGPTVSVKRPMDSEELEHNRSDSKVHRGDSSASAESGDAMVVDSSPAAGVDPAMPVLPGLVPPGSSTYADGPQNRGTLAASVDPTRLSLLGHVLPGSSTSVDGPLNSLQELASLVTANTLKIDAHNVCIKELLFQAANQADIGDMLCNTNYLNQVIVAGIRESPFGLGMMPTIKAVAHKLVLATKVHIGAIKTAVIQKYPLPKYGCLPDMKIIFNSGEAGTLFRSDANKLRKDKVGEWASIYVNNEITKATKVRIALLQSIASALQRLPSSLGKTVFVTKFESRPQLCIKTGDRIEQRFYYTEAIQKYHTLLKEADLAYGRKIAGKSFGKMLTPTFIVL